MRKVISNSTPLIALNKISRLDLLEKVYGEIIIPYGVYEEVILESNMKIPNDFIEKSGFIKIKNIKNEEARGLFVTSLHKGEVEVMILAKELKADLCIIDDLLARRYAKFYNLNVTGTVGVILKAKEKGIVSKVKPIMDELIKVGIYIGIELYNKVIEMAKEEY